MDILRGLSQVPAGFGEPDGTVVTIGVFDGVHRGHQLLINRAVEEARLRDLPSVVMTFDPHPVSVFSPEDTPRALATFEERARLIGELGVDHLVVIDFRAELAGDSPEQYVRDTLVGRLRAQHVVVGENFTFGAGARGTAETMVDLCHKNGVEVTVVSLLDDGSARISSTAIRNELAAGNIEAARAYLGRPFSVTAPVERGAGRGGRELGYPTANQYVEYISALPADGVYAGWFTILGSETELKGDMLADVRYPAAVSVGTNPTFGDCRRSVESFVLDRNADLYDHVARVEFVGKVRDMVKFDSVDELLRNMARDVNRTRDILGIAQHPEKDWSE
ncbi:Riboflavin biosynthesis protein RibF [Corynebacterium capitovis DSM 44611]|uniref:bifunctional riboflavin kinase/FAD synthetase n=1 Tax=Corynebacterium capitovis TaxID=131081 RepID=UPI00035C1E74|nr:bifunctional riboflavin kinase/FAD synthetase [Corynebacterium capitovis]WKD57482.1 Riboflavin biosynthesis protein RibF [Corynebacterium capitovis DSM 44611]